MTAPPPTILTCSVCHKPVALESSKTDERGDAVHEECYVSQLTAKEPPLETTRY